MYSVHFETLGCRLNQIESESAARTFVDSGFHVTMGSVSAASQTERLSGLQDESLTVLCVINTCTVTSKAEQKARRLIRLLLQKYPYAAVVVTGCYAQLDYEQIAAIDPRIAVLRGQLKDRLADIPAVLHSVCGAQGGFDAASFARELASGLFARAQEQTDVIERPFRLSTDTFLAHSRPSIKIQDGCNNHCAYCRIHLARGRSVSLDVQDVLDRVLELERRGQREVVFTTVNIGQYRGLWNGSYVPFSGLLKVVLERTSGICFRISSLYPEVVDREFCGLITDPRVRPHFHLSVQSGSDSVLSRMERAYTASQVYDAVAMLRDAKENPFLACDIIAGFPGETDDDFEQSLDLVKKCNFSWVHAFPFSARPGTPAYAMRPAVPQSVAGQRVARLTAAACAQKIAYIQSWAGRTLDAVAESVRNSRVLRQGASVLRCVTENFLHCEVPLAAGTPPVPGSAVRVRIVHALEDRITAGDEQEAAAALVD